METQAFNLCQGAFQKPLSAVLLGVTPELALMNWPKKTELTVVDHCPHMIEHVFPRSQIALLGVKIFLRDWRSTLLADRSADLIVGDGCYAFMNFPKEFDAFSTEMDRILSLRGRFITRVYIRREQPESADQIFADLFSRRIKSFHAFKWRLAASLHKDLAQGVCLGSVWEVWKERQLDAKLLADSLGWTMESIGTIDHYRGSKSRYYFPTLAEAKAYFSSRFNILQIDHPNYELGDLCPTFVLGRPLA